MISNLIAKIRRHRAAQPGFVYIGDDEASPLTGGPAAGVVETPIDQRWFVVNHELASVIVARWPGRLWRVEIVEPIGDGDPRAADQGPLAANAGWTRAASVRIVEEVPAAALFGDHGAAIAAIAQVVGELGLEEVRQLGLARHTNAAAAQTRTWHHWLAHRAGGGAMPADAIRLVASRPTEADSLDGTLDIFLRGRACSPVGAGLSVVSRAVSTQAERLAGPSVWETREDDPEGAWLGEPWAAASLALLDAALAFGAPQHVSAGDHEILTEAWRAVVGPDP